MAAAEGAMEGVTEGRRGEGEEAAGGDCSEAGFEEERREGDVRAVALLLDMVATMARREGRGKCSMSDRSKKVSWAATTRDERRRGGGGEVRCWCRATCSRRGLVPLKG